MGQSATVQPRFDGEQKCVLGPFPHRKSQTRHMLGNKVAKMTVDESTPDCRM